VNYKGYQLQLEETIAEVLVNPKQALEKKGKEDNFGKCFKMRIATRLE
jgi:hypothetical protein